MAATTKPYFESFATIPPFPDGLPCLDVERLSLKKLSASDENESRRLLECCLTTGVFLLKLDDIEQGNQLLVLAHEVLELGKHIFSLSSEEKMQYSMLNGNPILGYKAAGAGTIDSKGTPDRCEFWCMTKDDCLGIIPPLPALQVVNEQRDLFEVWTRACHQLCMNLLDRLDEQIGLPVGTLRSLHRIELPSTDHTRLICTPPQPENDRRTSLVPHTDFGSITILFNVLGGLQILPPDADPLKESDWQWVKPHPGCAIINLGDAMVKLTNGLFQSPIHRVTYPPGMQAPLTRHSLAYFVRPENDCVLKRINGSSMIPPLTQPEEDITTETWVQTRAKAHQAQQPGESERKFANWATVGYE